MKEFIKRHHTVSEFDTELKILERLREFTHPHIVTHLATWRQDDKYCMLFPYAECNLREYIQHQSFGPPDKENVLWILSQLCGLASALKRIHNFTTEPATLLVPSTTQESAWHHDLKPENILCFFNSRYPRRGSLQIADFGSGKVHILRSGSPNTHSANGTQTYEAPEAIYQGASSRPYDVWSMGCVFLEFLTWAMEDSAAVIQFTHDRTERRLPDSSTRFVIDDSFFQIKKENRPCLRKAVNEKIKLLRFKSLQQDGHSFTAVIDLVAEMLNIKCDERIKAAKLSNALEQIPQKM
jgi:serine/threonine protein kinase